VKRGRVGAGTRRVQAALHDAGLDVEVVVLEDSARTAVEAAQALGVEVGAIVKSLVFRDGQDPAHPPVLVLVSGDNRCDEALLGVTRADADAVREVTGYAIGGVPPVGHPSPLRTVVDERLGRFETLWAAAGTPHAVFPVSFAELVRLTGGEVRAVS
jgi:prolyl-tRNA editing enzyme YbaK/EbsC (Cys-tRNA(Pro) deacylase)